MQLNVIAGFLGSGKTTALLAQLAARRGRERCAIVVNDFGEAALDGTLLAESGDARIVEIPGGCVCCTAPEGLGPALATLIADVKPDRIFIEPTGLARPEDILDTIRRGPHKDVIAIGPLVVLVDPRRVARGEVAESALMRAQVEAADVLVANRIDLASEAEMTEFGRWTESLWPQPIAIMHTSHGEIPEPLFDWPAGTGPRAPRIQAVLEDCGQAHDHDHRNHDRSHSSSTPAADHTSTAGFAARSWVFAPDIVFARSRLDALLHDLVRDGAERVKGLFRTDEGVFLLEVAGRSVHTRPSGYRRDSRVDVIMRGLEGDADATWQALAGALESTMLTDAERALTAETLEIVRPGEAEPVRFTREALLALPDGVADVSALVPKRSGKAARLHAVMDSAGIANWREAEWVIVATDGLATPPTYGATFETAILVHTNNDGGPLDSAAGGPLRLLIPDSTEACANVKGVARIVVRAAPATRGLG